MKNDTMQDRRTYEAPSVEELGDIATLTLGTQSLAQDTLMVGEPATS